MKKLFITLAAVLMGMTAANAQLIVGGQLELGGSVGQKSFKDGVLTSKDDDSFNFGLAPKVGYLMMDGKLEVGAYLNIRYNATYNYYEEMRGDDYTYQFLVLKSNHKSACKIGANQNLYIGVNPYVRYYFLQKGVFSLGIQGALSLGGNILLPPKYYAYKGDVRNPETGEFKEIEYTKEEAKEDNKDMKEMVKDEKFRNFQYGLYVAPVMKFDLTDHFYMDITLNAIGLYLEGGVSTYKIGDAKMKATNFNGGFSALNTNGSAIAVGFAYKF